MIKIKVIDLLNKIANGEETFFETKLNDKSVVVKYYNDRNFSSSTDPEMLTIADIIKSLNKEAEIIEEDKKIKRIQSCGDNLYSEYIGQWLVNKENYTEYDELLMNKINEIIDYINKGE